MLIGLDHVQIVAGPGSEDRLRRFYCGVLGLAEIDKPEALRSRGGLWLDCGNMELHIGIDSTPPFNRPSKRHVAFQTADLAALRARLESAGYQIEDDRAPLPGMTRFYTRDPADNRVEFVQRD